MSSTRTRLSFEVRPYVSEDEPRVIELLTAALGGGPAGKRPPEFFRWKHLANPFGRSFMLVAETDGRIVGLRAFMRWCFHSGHRIIPAVRAVDTATHPDYQGQGVFSQLTTEALQALRLDTAFVFNTPNENSLPGYLKMGWREVGKVPVWIRVRRPIRLARGLRSLRAASAAEPLPPIHASSARDALADASAISVLIEASRRPEGRLTTPRTIEYLKWRYADAPLLDYRAVWEGGAGDMSGLAIFRVRRRGRLLESTVAEVFTRTGDGGTAKRLFRRVAAAAPVDHLACHFPTRPASEGVAIRSGFLRSPVGITLVVNPLAEAPKPDPIDLNSWALTLGDLEVF